MYEAFYGLREKPFNLTPDPRYLYLSEKHKEAFAHLLFGIKNRSGFVMVTGEIGTGKTTICRTLLNQLDTSTEIAFIFNPFLSPVELLRTINEEFGISSDADNVRDLIDELNRYLLRSAQSDKNCVLVIDEAQNLEPQVLEQIRLLSNLETETQKLLQIVLIGQPELGEHLELPVLRQLNQRITARYHLDALDYEETLQYIAYRLRVAGGRKKVRFTKKAVKTVYRLSSGTPRVINAICDRALLIGYTRETREITPAIIRKAAKEIRGRKVRVKRTRPAFPWPSLTAGRVAVAAGALAVIAVAVGLLPAWTTNPPSAADAEPDRSPRPMTGEPAQVSPRLLLPAEAAIRELTTEPIVDTAEPASFEERLADLSPAEARQAAASKLLQLWNLAADGPLPSDDAVETLRAFASENGLASEVLPAGLDDLEALNLPAFVKVSTEDDWMWLALVAIDGHTATVSLRNGDVMEVPRDELEALRAAKEAVILWRDAEGAPEILKPGSRGDVVAELQQRLRRAGVFEEDISGVYNDATRNAVEHLQRETGLPTDGLAGRQTRMVLSSWAPQGPTPALRTRDMPTVIDSALVTKPAAEPVNSNETNIADEPEPAETPPPAQVAASVPAEIPEPAPTTPPADKTDSADPIADLNEALAEQRQSSEEASESADGFESKADELIESDDLAPLFDSESSRKGNVTPPAIGAMPLLPVDPDNETRSGDDD